MDKLYIVIPAYNEKDNLEQVIRDWYPIVEGLGDGSRLVVIDDGSRDNTYQLLCSLAETRPQLQPLTKPNGGHGPTLLFGYRYALDHGADFVFQTDSDGQTDPAEFAGFWAVRDRYDAVLGHRAARGDGRSRAFVERVVCFLLRLYFGVRVPDANAPFRLMRAALLDKYLSRLPADYNLPNIMLTTYFAFYHERLTFREISFKPRQGGVNSINLKKIVKLGFRALGDFSRLRKDMKRSGAVPRA